MTRHREDLNKYTYTHQSISVSQSFNHRSLSNRLGGTAQQSRQCDNDNRNQYKYVCITTYQPDTKSNPNPNLNTTTKLHAIVNIQHSDVGLDMFRRKLKTFLVNV